ncbi:hypothetical protein BU15DRAFT_65891 [Melanogaster broomeanus]|nr:hypothetical protein BU15DRAFT_65891 [Melanogaster broomeanus]
MDFELPAYSASEFPPNPPPSHSAGSSTNTTQHGSLHSSSLEDSKGHKWLTLTVHSRAPHASSPPCFYQGDVISGQVDIDALKSESIGGIAIKVTAGRTNTEKEIWTPSTPLPDGSTVSELGKGKYSWLFSLTLPTEVEVHDQKTVKKFPLPPTFSERTSAVYLDYKLILIIKRGVLKVNQTLPTIFSYVPLTRAEPPSRMLQKAYRENLPLVGPEGDPDGWHVLPSVTIHGKIFHTRSVEVVLSPSQFAFANPLTYARGTSAPIWLTLTGNDEQALDLLSSPKAIKLLMVRSLAMGPDASNDDMEPRSGNTFFSNVARTVFWAPEHASAPGKRVLQGEVGIKPSLKPSTLFHKFSIRYHMELQPFEVPGLVVTAPTPKTNPLLKQKVTVVNLGAQGITMRSRAPPESVQEQAEDYQTPVPLLIDVMAWPVYE